MRARRDNESELVALSAMLDEPSLAHLVSYARYLAAQRFKSHGTVGEGHEGAREVAQAEVATEDETVIAAVRRLRRRYAMLDPRVLLGDVGEVMTRHATEEQSVPAAIAALEDIFARHYARYRGNISKANGCSSD